MPVPSHNPNCRTRMYKTKCWDCGALIFVFECNCGSAVLFNNNQPPFDRHTCSGGIGDSGFSGWNAIDVLRNEGMPITPDVLEIVFGSLPKENQKSTVYKDSEAISVSPQHSLEIIANIEDFHRKTKETEKANSLSAMARELEGIPKNIVSMNQITLKHNINDNPASYTALIPYKLCPSNIFDLRKSRAVVFAKLIGLRSWWLVEDIELL